MNLIEKLSSRLTLSALRFREATEGIVAVEFALIAPLMLTIFFGVTELSDGLEVSSKVTQVASTAADLVAQEKSVCNAEMTDVFSALNSIMFPYPSTAVSIRITSVIEGATAGTYKVAWSDAQNMSPLTVGSLVTGVPSGLVDTGGSVIYAEVSYDYTTVTHKWLTGAMTISDKFYLHPRRVAQVARTASGC